MLRYIGHKIDDAFILALTLAGLLLWLAARSLRKTK